MYGIKLMPIGVPIGKVQDFRILGKTGKNFGLYKDVIKM